MGPPDEHEKRFVAYLEKMVEDDNRAALAALRRGLGKEPGQAPEMFRYVVPWVPEGATRWDEEAHYLIAALFAAHQRNWDHDQAGPTNLGASLALLRQQTRSDAVERYLVALLNSHSEDLPHHLRRIVALLKSKEIPIDWARLVHDVRAWHREDREVQRDWARAFWSFTEAPTDQSAPAGPGAGDNAAPSKTPDS